RVSEPVRLGLEPGTPEALAAYGRDRRFDAVALAGLTDAMNRLFSNDVLPVRALRDVGLALVHAMPGAKAVLMREAAGRTARAPRAMRGGPI
ncbi:MAG: 2-octaprenyl-6-methoxyphenyl hydroxylase, partial [Methylobacteriaceae bacterium]|nr:2-octaprenyl-6-methoxyphenyl hydroxylase [Methylobacteriaceae bacterium]